MNSDEYHSFPEGAECSHDQRQALSSEQREGVLHLEFEGYSNAPLYPITSRLKIQGIISQGIFTLHHRAIIIHLLMEKMGQQGVFVVFVPLMAGPESHA